MAQTDHHGAPGAIVRRFAGGIVTSPSGRTDWTAGSAGSVRLLRPGSLLVARVLLQSRRRSSMPKRTLRLRGAWPVAAVCERLSRELLHRTWPLRPIPHDRHHARPTSGRARMGHARNLQRPRSRSLLPTRPPSLRLDQNSVASRGSHAVTFHDSRGDQASIPRIEFQPEDGRPYGKFRQELFYRRLRLHDEAPAAHRLPVPARL